MRGAPAAWLSQPSRGLTAASVTSSVTDDDVRLSTVGASGASAAASAVSAVVSTLDAPVPGSLTELIAATDIV